MAEGDVELGPVDIDHTVQLLLNYDEELQDRRKHHPGSIYMVPSVYRDLSPSSYTPRVVSIGPLHHQDRHLKRFEVQKAAYMQDLLHIISSGLHSTPEEILKECVTKISGSVDKIKACYIEKLAYPDSVLVEMMVKDACFILSVLNDRTRRAPKNMFFDMVLIENQIPFFVLQDIFDCTLLKLHPTLPLAKFLLRILNFCNIFEGYLVMDNSSISSTHDHILGFLHKSYQNPDRDSSILSKKVNAHSAVKLDRLGVRFSNEVYERWPMAMELEFKRFPCFPLSWTNPTLKMPVLGLYDGTELVIKNLIIYEYVSPQVQCCVTSYMFAMDMLIDTPEDVTRLVESQVLVNCLGSDEKAANIINSMLEGVLIEDFYYQDEWEILDQYYTVAGWRKVQTDFDRKYFSNPWSAIALLAGIVLFVLTVVQTIYGVKADVKD